MRRFNKAIIICIAFIIMMAFIGCSGTSSSGKTTSTNATHSKEYYEGVWVCAAIEMDGNKVRRTELTDEQKKVFPYLLMDLKDGSLGTVTDVVNGGGSPKALLFGEWGTTSNGLTIDGAEFTLDGDDLVSQQKNYKLYFDKCVSGSQLYVDTIAFDGITFDAPVELAYVYDGLKAQGKTTGMIDSCRSNGPTVMLMSVPAEFSDITEMTDYFAGYEEYFVNYNGANFFVHPDQKNHNTSVDFIANGKWYTIEFSYSEKDSVDYSDYAETFFTTIQVG